MTAAAVPGLCPSSTVLGRKDKSANTGQLLPFGNECTRVKMASGGACHLQ